MQTKILVTGGLGFIGTNLIHELENRGHEVWACDLMHSARKNYIRCDVSKYRQVERLFNEHNFDYVYHAAAEYGRWNGEDYYENLWHTNAVGTKNLLRLQEKKRFRLIFFGSAEVYGDYDGVMSEDVMDEIPIKQMNDYALSKWVNELQILNSATRCLGRNLLGCGYSMFMVLVINILLIVVGYLSSYTVRLKTNLIRFILAIKGRLNMLRMSVERLLT